MLSSTLAMPSSSPHDLVVGCPDLVVDQVEQLGRPKLIFLYQLHLPPAVAHGAFLRLPAARHVPSSEFPSALTGGVGAGQYPLDRGRLVLRRL